MSNPYIEIPTYENGSWYKTTFNTFEDYRNFVISRFKLPGQYNFDETSFEFNLQARKHLKNKFYCPYPEGSKDFVTYWDAEKEKCRKGVIYVGKKDTWYLPREYYMWINFLPINDKVKKKFAFPDVWDGQYHLALYELLAELHYKHCAVLKKRQFGSSYYHIAKMINLIWFEESPIIKMGASLKDYINEKGSWKFLTEYKSWLDSETAWYRPMNPGKVFIWQQQIQDIDSDGRETLVGLKGTIQGVTFDKDPTTGVGGACRFFFYEEGGVAPTMDTTVEYLFPAMESGDITTGLFVAAGSVGELQDCKPLESMIKLPHQNSIYPVETNLLDDKGTVGVSGLFIPEQWCMPPYIDEFGNSQVEVALAALESKFEKWKKELSPEKYQLRVSQHPRNIAEAFAWREVSLFPQNLVKAQKRRIEEKEYPYEFVELFRDDNGKVQHRITTKLPISEFPITKNTEDKTGTIVVWEKPDKNPEWGMYYASVDPVSEGKAEYINNMVYTNFGKKRIGDIEIGDLITSSSGGITSVTGIYPQGIKSLYKITFSDGHSILVCKNHLWSLKLKGGTKDSVILSTEDLMDPDKKISYLGTGRNSKKIYTINTFFKDSKGRDKWSIPIVKNPISFCTTRHDRIKIDPYLLGLLIGDGGLSQRGIRFSSVDQELIDYIVNILPDDLKLRKIKGSNCDYTISTTIGNRNSLSKILRHLGLKGKKSEHKFIPDPYIYSLETERLSLLQGLMDTDGSCTNHGAEFYSSSKKLAYNVVELVQSLGGIAKIRMKKTTHLDSYVVRVILPKQFCPFRLERKRKKYKPSKVFSRYITNIEYVKDDLALCISVDAPDHLYVTEHAIVTHNTTTSESLCSIYIYKNPVEVTRHDGEKTENFTESDKIVASWTGRFDDINKTHERLEMMIEWYNAWTIVENNISLFIQHMINKKKQKYLVPKNQILFLKDLGSNNNVFQDYGWKNTGTLFKSHMLSYLIEYLKEEIDVETKTNGDIVKIKHGIERIPDLMAMIEMEAYNGEINVDRLVALTALIAFAKVQQANRGYRKRIETTDKKYLEKSAEMFKLDKRSLLFKNMGHQNSGLNKKPVRNAYRNLR